MLHTIFCGSESKQKRECAACDPNVYALAKHLPFAHIRQTQIRCSLTDELLQEADPPYRMPSGYLIAESAINNLEAVNDMCVCPKTGQKFDRGELRKVYFS